VYYDFLNSYATELAETGQKQEGRNISRIVLASPFAPAYPEWKETGLELGVIECKEPHSYVSIKALPEPEVKTDIKPQKKEKAKPESAARPARVISFPPLKEAPQPQKPDRLSSQEYPELTTTDKQEMILAALKSGAIDESHYYKMMVMLGLIEFGPSDKIIDLEDHSVLYELMIDWAHQVDTEDFVAVLSALRDCEDTDRRNDIIDRMIRIAFEETQECGLNEEAWRLRVERRLPKK
jgi:hypothetical protein